MVDMNIGDRLKKLREDAGLDQVQAAKIADTTKQAVSQIENGRTKVPGGLYLFRWAKHYGVDLEWLITGKGSRLASSSQSTRLTRETIVDAVKLATGSVTKAGMPSFEIETIEDAELLVLAMEAVLEDGIHGATDSDVQRFARKFGSSSEEVSGKFGTSGSNGRAGSAARTAKTGEEGQPATRRSRKSA